jgi:hypothetical protein
MTLDAGSDIAFSDPGGSEVEGLGVHRDSRSLLKDSRSLLQYY